MTTQADVFLVSIIYGIILTVIYDSLRCLRRIVPHNNIFIGIEDIFYWLSFACIVISLIYTYNNGELRGYVVLGMALGSLFYLMLFSRLVVKGISFIFGKAVHFLMKTAVFLTKPIKKCRNSNKHIEKYTKKG